MALSLLLQASSEGRSSPGAHRSRWMFAPDLPTTLRESQLAIAGCVLPSARGGAQRPRRGQLGLELGPRPQPFPDADWDY